MAVEVTASVVSLCVCAAERLTVRDDENSSTSQWNTASETGHHQQQAHVRSAVITRNIAALARCDCDILLRLRFIVLKVH